MRKLLHPSRRKAAPSNSNWALRGLTVKANSTVVTTAACFTVFVGSMTPVAAFAAAGKSPDAMYLPTDNVVSGGDADAKDIDGRLAEARARLEQAAREVAELSSEMGRSLTDQLMVPDGDGPSRAVIGVQLDPGSGKEGARVQEVSPGGPADEAGLRAGDLITGINGTDVKGEGTARQVLHLMHKVAPESKVNVRVTRDGKSRDFVVMARRGMTFLGMHEPPIAPLPPIPPHFPDGAPFGPLIIHGPLGEMELATLTPQLGRYFGTDKGVLVVRAPKDFKLEDGDVILSIDGREPASGSHATRILSSYQPGEKIAIKIMRQQKTLSVETTLPEREPLTGPGRDRKAHIMPHGHGTPAT